MKVNTNSTKTTINIKPAIKRQINKARKAKGLGFGAYIEYCVQQQVNLDSTEQKIKPPSR